MIWRAKSMKYRIYNREGHEIGTTEMARGLAQADVVLFGELHGTAWIHRLQLELTREIFSLKKDGLVLGVEMFEADNQLILDEYLAGKILHRHLADEAKTWQGYETDYRPLVEFAREQGLRFIATNIPRRYANLVAREGLAALGRLSAEAARYMAPLPITVDLATPGYRELQKMGAAHGMGMVPENFVAAQAVKDATMAHFIMQNRPAAGVLLHFNGDYHSRCCGGICWHLKQADPELSIVTIASVAEADPVFRQEYESLGEFILVGQRS